jgi:hypothetical protein
MSGMLWKISPVPPSKKGGKLLLYLEKERNFLSLCKREAGRDLELPAREEEIDNGGGVAYDATFIPAMTPIREEEKQRKEKGREERNTHLYSALPVRLPGDRTGNGQSDPAPELECVRRTCRFLLWTGEGFLQRGRD